MDKIIVREHNNNAVLQAICFKDGRVNASIAALKYMTQMNNVKLGKRKAKLLSVTFSQQGDAL